MANRIEVCFRNEQLDSPGRAVVRRITEELGITVSGVRTVDVYTIDSGLSRVQLEKLAQLPYSDPVIQAWSLDSPAIDKGFDWALEIGFRPGVTDNVGRTAGEVAELMFGTDFDRGSVYTSRQYLISGELSHGEVEVIAKDLLANALIQRWEIMDRNQYTSSGGFAPYIPVVSDSRNPSGQVEEISLDLSDDELAKLSSEKVLALSVEELVTIREHFKSSSNIEDRRRHELGTSPTDVELECLAQTWSEHCKHKIFNARISFRDHDDGRRVIDGIFRNYIRGTTEKVRKDKGETDYCRSVFVDNAGVIAFDDDWNIVFKVETHNSPSALDPYGGALTGIVGVNRDPFGTGLGARLFCNTDVFCLASPFFEGEIPPRLLHPRRILEGVRLGVEHGGNKSGIPTVNGSLVFDERYLGKPLVYCGTGGIMPATVNGRPAHEKAAEPGDRIVMVGGRIGKDGIHGATFSSEALHQGSPATAVQIGDPITQKRMTDFLLVCRDEDLYNAITDNGAGGLSSSVGEMAQDPGGARIELSTAPLKYPGLAPWEILLSEAQERMTVAVPPSKIDRFMELAAQMRVEASDLGEFTSDGYFHVMYESRTVGLIDMEFLHDGLPQMELEAEWSRPAVESSGSTESRPEVSEALKKILGRLNVCSKHYWVRQYDHEVQGGSVVKPLVGTSCDGPSDAAVVRPVLESDRGLAVSHGICPRYIDIDPYRMAQCAVDEAVRNAVAVGADPDYMAALDNFCWSDPVHSPDNPEGRFKLGQLVLTSMGLYDTCVAYGVPLISGKDSMKNDYRHGDIKISIPPTLLVSVIGVVPDVHMSLTMDFRKPQDLIYVAGVTRNETGAGEYSLEYGIRGGVVPGLADSDATHKMYVRFHTAAKEGLVASCHDISDGGLGVAAAESAFAGGTGMQLDLREVIHEGVDRDDSMLFSETPGRLLVSVKARNAEAFEQIMGKSAARAGMVTDTGRMKVTGLSGSVVIDESVDELKECWYRTLDF